MPSNGKARKQGKKNRKWGRNAEFCVKYTRENRLNKNKVRSIARHLKQQPNDKQASTALKHYEKEIY